MTWYVYRDMLENQKKLPLIVYGPFMTTDCLVGGAWVTSTRSHFDGHLVFSSQMMSCFCNLALNKKFLLWTTTLSEIVKYRDRRKLWSAVSDERSRRFQKEQAWHDVGFGAHPWTHLSRLAVPPQISGQTDQSGTGGGVRWWCFKVWTSFISMKKCTSARLKCLGQTANTRGASWSRYFYTHANCHHWQAPLLFYCPSLYRWLWFHISFILLCICTQTTKIPLTSGHFRQHFLCHWCDLLYSRPRNVVSIPVPSIDAGFQQDW